ncbi:MAG TPA: M20/M25/M40 family metallo-hydrolase [Bacteroidales bacterium]|nr:M20/M25/M40 family metallo-hydrolase [Bacteroidales bacterium]
MKKRTLFVFLFLSGICLYAQDPAIRGLNSINRNVLQSQLEFLSSDWMEGRRSGERGEKLASEYISSMLKLYGVKPWGDRIRTINLTGSNDFEERSYFQQFSIVKRQPGKEQLFRIIEKDGGTSKVINLDDKIDFSINTLADAEVEAPVIFVGFGIRNKNSGIDEVSGLSLKGKFIIRITGITDKLTKLSPAEVTASMKEFESYAVQQGAAGILDVDLQSQPGSPSLQNTAAMSPAEYIPRPMDSNSRYSLPEESIVIQTLRATISIQAANLILKGPGDKIQNYLSNPDPGRLPQLQPEENKIIYIKTTVDRTSIPVRNVIGIIEGNKPDEIVVLGAHYDHMGMNNGYIWNGADDNGSGTVGIMTIAKALMETGTKPEKTIIIALWTAEEQGLFGSEYFLRTFDRPSEKIILNLNMDMISRYISDDQPNKVVMTYTSSEKSYRNITESNLREYSIRLNVDFQPSDKPTGSTDHRNFMEMNIPIMRFKPGHREEYHTPNDETSTIDWDIMEKIVRISFLNIWKIAFQVQ